MDKIDRDIKRSYTLPTNFYKSEAIFQSSLEAVFANSWLYVGDLAEVNKPGHIHPFTLMENVLDEPLVFNCNKKEELHCLSNVCTHRGKIIVEKAGSMPMLRCGYHGRCFRLDGSFKSTPGFEGAENFPSKEDDLSTIAWRDTMGLLFTSLSPTIDFDTVFDPIVKRLNWLSLDELVYDAATSKDYYIVSGWIPPFLRRHPTYNIFRYFCNLYF